MLKTLRTDDAKPPLDELQGYERLASGDNSAAFDHIGKASSKRTESLWKADKALIAPAPAAETPGGTDVATAEQTELNTLGSLAWSPFPAEPLTGTNTAGKSWALTDLKSQGKNVLVLFFLGGKWAHCIQQIGLLGKEYEALRKRNVDTVDTQGNVRFRRISSDPFLEVEFLKTEAARVNRMLEQNQSQANLAAETCK